MARPVFRPGFLLSAISVHHLLPADVRQDFYGWCENGEAEMPPIQWGLGGGDDTGSGGLQRFLCLGRRNLAIALEERGVRADGSERNQKRSKIFVGGIRRGSEG